MDRTLFDRPEIHLLERSLSRFVYHKNDLIGDWIGREGMGFEAGAPIGSVPGIHCSFDTGTRKWLATSFLAERPLNDGSLKLDWWFCRDFSFSASVQNEHWQAPLLATGSQSNWTSSVEISFHPQKLFRRSAASRAGAAGNVTRNEGLQ